jgi:hypothetical protein
MNMIKMNAMKKIYQLAGMALLVALSACSSSDDWTPGEESVCVNQLYFTSDAPATTMLSPGETTSYTLQLTREYADSEITVPLTKSGNGSNLFEVPESVTFAAGEETVSVPVSFNGAEDLATYSCVVSVPDGAYNSPYTSLTSSLTISLTVAEWVKLHDVSIDDDQGYIPTHAGVLYNLGGTNRYKLENFMKGYDFYFTLSENANSYGTYDITPEGGSMYGTLYWYFGSDTWNSSFPLYLPDDDTTYFDYAYTYLATGYAAVNWSYKNGFFYFCANRNVNGEWQSASPNWDYVYFYWKD